MANQTDTRITLGDFLYQEAVEKSFEIEVKARKEYERLKNEIKQKEVIKLNDEFEQKVALKVSEMKIAHSANINSARLSCLSAKNKTLLKLLNETQNHIVNKVVHSHEEYKKLLKEMITQGLVKLMEPNVVIRCLKRDEKLVQEVLKHCLHSYKEILKKELNRDEDCQVEIDTSIYLEERKVIDITKKNIKDITEEDAYQIYIQKNEDDQKWQTKKNVFQNNKKKKKKIQFQLALVVSS